MFLEVGGGESSETVVIMEKASSFFFFYPSFLPTGGRLALIQSPLIEIPIYYLSLFRMLVSVSMNIEILILVERVWRGVHFVEWEVVLGFEGF